jgi:phosphatidylinositol alpha-1,6-mannosyltransferase
MLIQCMPAILSQVPEAIYLIVGDGPGRARLITKVKECRLEEKVVFAGAVPDEKLPEFYAACDVFAMPSRIGTSKHGGTMGEGFGIVFVEAGAMGKPVVGGRSGGIPDAVVDGVTGLLVEPTDLEQISRGIISLLLDSQLRCRMGQAGRKRAQEHFQWEIAAQNISGIVDSFSRRSLE